jgi:hypothetical protein
MVHAFLYIDEIHALHPIHPIHMPSGVKEEEDKELPETFPTGL